MAVIDPDRITNLLVECSNDYILPRYNALLEDEISTKTGPNDLVTQADIDVEEHLKKVLPDCFPGSIVVGEEGVSRGEISLDVLNDASRPIWIVDPVDGTYNFVHGKREFAIMLGLIIDGVTQHAWIHDVLAETASVAERGAGAFKAGERLHVHVEETAKDMIGHINPRYFPAENREHIIGTREQFKECRSLSCAGHEYLRLAHGEAHFSVYSRHKPWDHIPGELILSEAGGIVRHMNGDAYVLSNLSGGIIAASNEKTLGLVQTVFNL